jgi:RNA polymerase sigma factor (sigma-70 family)
MKPAASDELGERQLIRRVASGDADALALLFARYAAVLHRLAYRLLGSADEADDVVQDVFVGLRMAFARYEERGNLERWLRQVTSRVALMRLRSERRRLATAQRSMDFSDISCFPSGDAPLRHAIDEAIAELSDELRTVFVLRVVEDYSHEEIASALGIRVGTSKVRLHRAVRRLRRRLDHLKERK